MGTINYKGKRYGGGYTNNSDTTVIDVARKRNFILLGDSFGGGITPNVTTEEQKGWIYWFKQMCNPNYTIYDNTDVIIEGNSGFSSSARFLTQIQSIANTIIDKNKITDIVVFSGTNDIGIVSETLKTDVATFCDYCTETFPNAEIRIGVVGTNLSTLYSSVLPSYKECQKHGATFVKDTVALFCLPQYISSDNTHLTQEGYEFYAPYMNQAIITGHTSFKFSHTSKLTNYNESVFKAVPSGEMQLETIITENTVQHIIHDNGSNYGYLGCNYYPQSNSSSEVVLFRIETPIHTPILGQRFHNGEIYMMHLIDTINACKSIFANYNLFIDTTAMGYVRMLHDVAKQDKRNHTWSIDLCSTNITTHVY